jgi:DNA polymerase I-like protein with 3'-5' exonuclease and polymerase domains
VKFSETNDIAIADGKIIYNRYHHSYPGVKNGYHKMLQAMLNKNRTTVNPLGRRRTYLDRWGEDLFNAAYNNFAQSTVADVINERGLEYVYYDQRTFGVVELLLQVHDSIVFQIPTSIPLGTHAQIILAIKSSLERPLEWRGRAFSLPIDLSLSIGNMGKFSKQNISGLREIKRDKLTPTDLTQTLEEIYREMSGA